MFMKIINTEKMVIKSWCNEPEEGCIAQAKNLANLPFVFRQVCLMPDTHQGYGMPIGGVIATRGVVIPNAVGVDIGCGMLTVKTSLKEITTERIKEIMTLIRKYVPLGFEHHSQKQDESLMPISWQAIEDANLTVGDYHIVSQEYNSALKQIGTLGGGNHFIEIQRGSDGHIWFMIHSGSRNIGLKVAREYNEIAIELNKRWYSSVPKEHELAFLPIETKEAKQYLKEMNFCLDFAYKSRQLMAERIKMAFCQIPCSVCGGRGGHNGEKCSTCGGSGITGELSIESLVLDTINIHHNYARFEHHFGSDVVIHRKGATLASTDTIGLIPGSQGTCSYVVKGKGNPESFNSCSHGAGRRMGRKEACRKLNLEEEKKKLEDKGIVHAIRGVGDLDEASGAYKDIDVVMEEQKDLVEILVKLEPLAVIKG